MSSPEISAPPLRRIRLISLGVGVIGLVLCAIGWLLSADDFFRAYLFAYLFWFGCALGSLALLMVQFVVGGLWGLLIRRILEAASQTLPLMALLFVPILLGMSSLYEWTHAEAVAASEVLQRKTSYLNVPFFIGRAAIYFVIWIGLALLIRRWSRQQERGETAATRRLRLISKGGLVLYVLSISFASVDWVMSLEPEWFSTIYGMLFLVGQGVQALCLGITALAWLSERQPYGPLLNADRYRDLGNVLLTFVMLWAYVSFSQFIIIWSGNLPEEITWYLHRTTGGWEWIGILLIVFHFFLPFFMLLLRFSKQHPRVLAGVALGVLLIHLINDWWLVIPAFRQGRIGLSWLDLVAPLAIGGLWLATWLWRLGQLPLLPLHDPRLDAAAAHGSHGVAPRAGQQHA